MADFRVWRVPPNRDSQSPRIEIQVGYKKSALVFNILDLFDPIQPPGFDSKLWSAVQRLAAHQYLR